MKIGLRFMKYRTFVLHTQTTSLGRLDVVRIGYQQHQLNLMGRLNRSPVKGRN